MESETADKSCLYVDFSIVSIISHLLILGVILISGAIIMRYLHPAAMIAYLIFSGISFVVILFSVCRNCFYYGRRCYMLLGLLAGLILKKGDMKLYRPHSRVVWPFLLGLLFIPLCTATMILIIRYSNIMLLWLIANVMGVAALVIAARYSTCPHCRMQGLCPFCIAKKRLKAEEAQLLPTGLYH